MNSSYNPVLLIDSYKLGHAVQYPKGTEFVYSNFTPRSSKHFGNRTNKVVWFGLQGFLKELKSIFDNNFFNLPKESVVKEVADTVIPFVGPSGFDISRIEALHNLGYLPIKVKSLPEGSKVNIGVPVFTICNTLPEFFWVTNFLETLFSCELWKPTTSATIAYEYRKILTRYAEKTGSPIEFVDWQAHDFSMRGMSNSGDAAKSGAGHLLPFTGTDCLPAVSYLTQNYSGYKTFIGGSVPATEHSVMCMGGKESEIETFRRLITETYPSGIVSIVSDTWDFWKVLTQYAVILKEEILNRGSDQFGNSKVVFRPDSGDPVDIICGLPENVTDIKNGKYFLFNEEEGWEKEVPECEFKGAIECLWDIFGGTINENGYKVLNPKVGLIYGDSITLDRCEEIMCRLEAKGFASCNIVLGVGSYTYQYNTRDTFGFAMKATYGIVNGEGREIFKSPKTDSGTKKSACGLLRVEREGDNFVLYDKQTEEQEKGGGLRVVFEDGTLYNETTLEEIRARVRE